MKRNQSALKLKTKFERIPLMSPNVTFLRECKGSFITRNLKMKTRSVSRNKLPTIRNDPLNTIPSILQSKESNKDLDNNIINEPYTTEMTKTLPSTIIADRNLYKEIIEPDLKKKIKDYNDNDSQMSKGRKTRLNIPKPKIKDKIDLNQKTKGIAPVIDDLDEFVNIIKEKHKDLFEKMIPLLFRQQMPHQDNQDGEFTIPLLLYEDYKYFINRFFPKKHQIKPMTFGDSNMLYPSLLDYNSYIQKFTEYISHFKSDNFVENALNFDNKFYGDFIRKIQGKDMKIISFTKGEKGSVEKEGRLDEKYQNFINELNKKAFKSSNSVDSSNDNNAIRSILKKHNNIRKQLFTKEKRRSSIDLDNEDNDNNNYINNDNQSKSDSVSEKDEFLELHSQADSKRSNSYLDNSYIFQKNANDKENQMKFSVQIKKNIILEKKKEQGLYDKYFGRLNKKYYIGV